MAADARRFAFLGNWDDTDDFTVNERRHVLLASLGFLDSIGVAAVLPFWRLMPEGADAFSALSLGVSPFSVVPEDSPAFSEDAASASSWGEVPVPTTQWS